MMDEESGDHPTPSPQPPSSDPLPPPPPPPSLAPPAPPAPAAQPLPSDPLLPPPPPPPAQPPSSDPLPPTPPPSQQSQPSQSSQQPPPQTESSGAPLPKSADRGSHNLLDAIEAIDSAIPDSVVHHFLNSSGMKTNDQRIVKLIAVAAQKFIHDIVSDSLQHCKLRGSQAKKTKEKKYTLAIEDLSAALAEYGIEVNRPQYFN